MGSMSAFVKPGQKVLLKPNILGGFTPAEAVTTHPAVVRAASLLVQAAGGTVLVGDSPGTGGFKGALQRSGIAAVVEETAAEIADFETALLYECADNRIAKRIQLAKGLGDADVIITLPKLKTHVQMGFTCALKNQFGLVVGMEKAKYHYRFQRREWLAALMIEINRIARPALAIVDAIVGMEGHGPSGGEPRHLGALIASPDLAAADVVACELIGLDPSTLPLIKAAAEYDFGCTSLKKIQLTGHPLAKLQVPDFKNIKTLGSVLNLLPVPRFCYSWVRRILTARPEIQAADCVHCGACERGCPVEPPAIHPEEKTSRQLEDANCIRCYCCHEFCPVKAIKLRRSLPDRLFGINEIMHFAGRCADALVARFSKPR
ncbi:MAG: DUF362 domain-containing protein [Planctomycetes bacterium]|nr:DUF362 domain-containing protein [Planctomycetota bacterium]